MGAVIKTTLAILKAREVYSLELIKPLSKLVNFTTLNKGDAFRVKKCWAINNISEDSYLVSYTNSYRVNIVKSEIDYQPGFISSNYLGAFVRLNNTVPDSIIQPLSLTEKVMNLFFHENIHLENHQKFNKIYQLQSIDKSQIIEFLNDRLISTIEKYDDLHIEIRNNECMVFFIRPIQEDDALILIDVVANLLRNESLSTT